MYCTKCNKHIIECTCLDIEERLKKLQENPVMSIAATSNLLDRKIKRNLNERN